jgi:hypothetical protein
MAGTNGTLHSRCHCLFRDCTSKADLCQIFYTLSSFYIIFLMTSVYARTREREKAWKFGLYCLSGAILVTPLWYLAFKEWVFAPNTFMKVRRFSEAA